MRAGDEAGKILDEIGGDCLVGRGAAAPLLDEPHACGVVDDSPRAHAGVGERRLCSLHPVVEDRVAVLGEVEVVDVEHRRRVGRGSVGGEDVRLSAAQTASCTRGDVSRGHTLPPW